MEQLRVSQLKSRVSLVVCTVDSYTSDTPIGAAKHHVYLEGIRSKAISKSNGSYIFSDLPGGSYRLCVEAEQYFNEQAEITLGSTDIITYMPLQPLPSYPFPQGATLLRVCLAGASGRSFAEARLTATVLSEDCARARLMQDKAEAGADEITAGSLTGMVSVGDRFLLRGRGAKEGEEAVRIAQVLEHQKRFRLEAPLSASYVRGALLLPVVHTRFTERGEAAAAFANCRMRSFPVKLEIAPGGSSQTLVKEVMVAEGQTTNLGKISL